MAKLQRILVFSFSVSEEPVAMEGLPEIDMINLSGVLFKFLGESKSSTTSVLRCFRIFNVVIFSIATWFAFVNFFYVEGEMYVQALQTTILFAHVLLKYLSILIYKSDIRGLLIEIVNGILDYRCYSGKIAQEVRRVHRAVERFQRIMVIVAAICSVLHVIKPFLAVNRGLLLEAFVPPSNVMDAIALFSQFYCFGTAIAIVLGYDFIYLGLCVHVVIQFKLLKHNINDALKKHNKETTSQINACIRHHQFLYMIRLRMQNIYSITLLFHYGGTLISTCVVLLDLVLRHTTFTNYVTKLITVLIFVVQFALYAFPADQVASEFVDFSDAIYTSFWYKNDVSHQKTLLYVMMTAQRVQHFSGAGLIDINVDAFESVFRKAFSFSSITSLSSSLAVVLVAAMDELLQMNMIDIVVDLYHLIGEIKHKTSRKLFGFRIFNACAYTIVLSFIFANFFYVGEELYVQTFQSFLIISHTLLKYLLLMHHKSSIECLLANAAQRFWNYRDFNKNTVRTFERIYGVIRRVQAVILIVAVLGIYAYILKPSFVSNKGLILESFVPRSYVMDAAVLMSQFYCFGIAIPIVIGFDFIYFALCAHVVLQLRLLKLKLKQILNGYGGDRMLEMSYCIRHHQFLFSMFFRMKSVYSVMLLFHYFGSLVSACSVLFELMLRDTNFMNYIAKSISVLIFIGQFALYTFPAEQVAFEFTDVSDAIYSSYWYRNSIPNQRILLYVMVTAQRVHYFTGAGLVNINTEAFESVSGHDG
ncbi:hypothetical protein Trydic_g17491 [Trypoxylus dichotomus]